MTLLRRLVRRRRPPAESQAERLHRVYVETAAQVRELRRAA